jgi:hypothetical protein
MGQFAAAKRGPLEMLEQALALFRLADELDETYLENRLREETLGQYDLAFLKSAADETDNNSAAS